jgi:hypothetical protein
MKSCVLKNPRINRPPYFYTTKNHNIASHHIIQNIFTMKFCSAFLTFFLLGNAAEARLFGKRAKAAKESPNGPHNLEERQFDRYPSMKQSKSSKKISAETRTDASSEEDQEVQRNTNQVRITLVDVDDKNSMSPKETIFFEETFMSAFLEIQDNSDDDVHVRSMIVLSDSSSKNNRLRRRNRSLWSTPGRYFDIAALFEWSCRFCRTSSYHADDDHADDDFYFNGSAEETSSPTASPTAFPTANPTASPTDFWFDDDHTDDDFYFGGAVWDGGITTPQGDAGYTDDIFSFVDNDPDDDWAFASPWAADDDIYSFLFGNRLLRESDERRLEKLLCAKLRRGPYHAFKKVKECFVVFEDE